MGYPRNHGRVWTDAYVNQYIHTDSDIHRNAGGNIDGDIYKYEYTYFDRHVDVYADEYVYQHPGGNRDVFGNEYGNRNCYSNANLLDSSVRPVEPSGNKRNEFARL